MHDSGHNKQVAKLKFGFRIFGLKVDRYAQQRWNDPEVDIFTWNGPVPASLGCDVRSITLLI